MIEFLLIAVLIMANPAAGLYGSANGTVVLPPGSTNHGDPSLLCTPPSWTDIAIFYLGNYFAHAATVISIPGESPADQFVTVLAALIFPLTGAYRAVCAIRSLAVFGNNELDVAARAGAVVTAIRRDRSYTSRISYVGLVEFREREPGGRGKLSKILSGFGNRSLQGDCEYHDNYKLVVVPGSATFDPFFRSQSNWRMTTPTIANNFSISKSLVALVQAIYAASTLYSVRGNQVQVFGYAAFGFTVLPYLLMSLLNLSAGILCPGYSALLLVESSDMRHGRELGQYHYEGAVGRLKDEHTWIETTETSEETTKEISATEEGRDQGKSYLKADTPVQPNQQGASMDVQVPATEVETPEKESDVVQIRPSRPRWQGFAHHYRIMQEKGNIYAWIIVVIIYAVIGGLSGFKPGSSTTAQRVWIMTWLVFGNMVTIFRPQIIANERHGNPWAAAGRIVGYLTLPVLCSIPAFGGFVVVGQMLQQYGNCIQLG